MNRRNLLRAAACTTAGLMAGLRPAFAADAEIEVSPQAAGPEISPHIYGHFIEHLGAVIYDGIWVGRDSKIPNLDGIRRQFVDDMKRIGAPNYRWPGGCFADGYHWRDGIGRGARPRTYNFWQDRMPPGLDHTETNQFGIHEFIRLCRPHRRRALPGRQRGLGVAAGIPRLGALLQRSGEHRVRGGRARGQRRPGAVRREMVGRRQRELGMRRRHEASGVRHALPAVRDPVPGVCAEAVSGGGRPCAAIRATWTWGGRRGSSKPCRAATASVVDGLSMHFYTDFRNTKEKVATFDARGWYDVIREGLRTESVIERHWAAMGKYDPTHRTKLIVDEWGVWYPPGEETAPAHLLSQPLTLRDALHTAVTFDVFNRHADKVAMANVAQTINCIHSLFLAQGDRYTRTPVYYVFEMYKNHMGARSVPLRVRCDELAVPGERRDGEDAGPLGFRVAQGRKAGGDADQSLARFAGDGAHPAVGRKCRRGARQRAHARRYDGPQHVRPSGGSEARAAGGERPRRHGGSGDSETRGGIDRGEGELKRLDPIRKNSPDMVGRHGGMG